jgi:hypothetical protein
LPIVGSATAGPANSAGTGQEIASRRKHPERLEMASTLSIPVQRL